MYARMWGQVPTEIDLQINLDDFKKRSTTRGVKLLIRIVNAIPSFRWTIKPPWTVSYSRGLL